jgi:hypothetical protein
VSRRCCGFESIEGFVELHGFHTAEWSAGNANRNDGMGMVMAADIKCLLQQAACE